MDFTLFNSELKHNTCFINTENPLETNGEKGLFNKLTSLLSGIPPPPALATSKLTCYQMLESIKLNTGLLNFTNVASPLNECNPRVFYLNKESLSEEIAELTMKLQSRFVQSETASSYSIQTNIDRQLSNSARKRRQWNGISPGRRLSHLAKRRQMFSKANLQQLSKNEPKVHKIAISKPSAQRNLAMEYLKYKDHTTKEKNLPKRALFQSPEDDVLPGFRTIARNVPRRKLFEKPERSVQLPSGGGSYDVSGWLATQPFLGGKKRSREESRDSDRKRRCPRRSLDFSDGSPSQCSDASAFSNGFCQAPPVNVPLTQVQKQKLLWAVAVVLKEKKITHKDSNFKKCATKLFTICKKNLGIIQSLAITAGTSEKMLTYARSRVDEVINYSDPTTINASGILHDLSFSTLNKKQNESPHNNIMDGKENVTKTPKRRINIRHWQTCIKSLGKRKSRLNKSLSFDDLRDLNDKQLNTNINDTVFKFVINSPIKIRAPAKRKHTDAFDVTNDSTVTDCLNKDDVKDSIILGTPDKCHNNIDCIPGSQEEMETHNFPALKRNVCVENKSFCERSPDLFEQGDSYHNSDFNCTTSPKEYCLANNYLPIELKECEDNFNLPLPVNDVLIKNELLSSAVIEISKTPEQAAHTSFNDVPSLSVTPMADESIAQILELSKTAQETDIITDELPKLFTEVAFNTNHSSPQQSINESLKHSDNIENGGNIDTTHMSYNFSESVKNKHDSNISDTAENNCKNDSLLSDERELTSSSSSSSASDEPSTDNVTKGTPTSEKSHYGFLNDNSYVDIIGDDEDKPSSTLCTSTPLVEFPKKLKIKSKPAWRLEAGPGLKIRMRLSKDWNIVDSAEGISYEGNSNIDLDMKAKPAETQIDNTLVRKICNGESSGTSMDSYTLNELKDRLAIEKTLATENSDLSLFDSDSEISSCSENDQSYENIDLLRNQASQSENSSYSKDLIKHHSFGCADLERKYDINDIESHLKFNKVERCHSDGSKWCMESALLSCSNISIENSIDDNKRNDYALSLLQQISQPQEASCSNIGEILDEDDLPIIKLVPEPLVSSNNDICDDVINSSNMSADEIAPSDDDNVPLVKHVPEKIQTTLISSNVTTDEIATSDDDDVPLFKHVCEKSRAKLVTSNVMTDEIAPSDDDDVPLVKSVAEKSQTTLISFNVTTDEVATSDDDDVPLVKHVCEKSRAKLVTSNVTTDEIAPSDDDDVPLVKSVAEKSQTTLISFNVTTDEVATSDDDDVPLVKHVCEKSRAKLVTSNMTTDEISPSDDDDEPLVKHMSEKSQAKLVTSNMTTDEIAPSDDDDEPLVKHISEKSQAILITSNMTAVEIAPSDQDNVPLVQHVPEKLPAILITSNGMTDKIAPSDDEDVPLVKHVSGKSQAILTACNVTIDESEPSDDEDVPLIQLFSESSISAIAEIYQPKSITPFIRKASDCKEDIDGWRKSTDENVPLIQLIPNEKEKLNKNTCSDMRLSIDDNLPLIYLVPASESKANNFSHDAELSFASQFPSDSDTNDEDVPLSQLAENSTCSSLFNHEDDNLPLIHLKHEKNNKGSILDGNNSITSSGAEDTPLCNLISQNCNNKIVYNRQASREDEKTPLLQLSKTIKQSSNILENNKKTLKREVRHFKEIGVIKNRPESYCSQDPSDKMSVENNHQTPSKVSNVSESTTDSRLIPMSAGSDTSTGKSKNKLSFESYKARKKLVLEESNSEQVSPPKKIYNIRLKKKERHSKKGERIRFSIETDDECRQDRDGSDSDNIDKLFIDKAKTFVNAFSTISCMVDQEMKLTVSAIADDEEREKKLRKLSDVSQMSENILQAFFEQIPNVKGIFTSDSSC